MKHFILILLNLFLFSCENLNTKLEENQHGFKMSKSELISQVKLAINPQFQDWVLFENGTYIIFDKADTIPNIDKEAIKMMKEFGPVISGGSAGDFGVTTLNKTDGWVVSGHAYGMYTFVHISEIKLKNPVDSEIGLYGRNKRNLDGSNPVVIYINRKNNS